MLTPNPNIDLLWDGTKSAGLYSGLSAVLAGFCFVGLTLIVTSRPKEDIPASGENEIHLDDNAAAGFHDKSKQIDENGTNRPEPEGSLISSGRRVGLLRLQRQAIYRRATRTLIAAFLTLIVTAYLWGDAAGDSAYQVRTAISLAGPTVGLGLGALQMLLAITQMLEYFDPGAERTVGKVFALLVLLVTFSFGVTVESAISLMGYRGWLAASIGYLMSVAAVCVMTVAWLLFSNRNSRSSWHDWSQRFVTMSITLGAVVYFVLPNSSSRWSGLSYNNIGVPLLTVSIPHVWRIISLSLMAAVYGLAAVSLWLLIMSLPRDWSKSKTSSENRSVAVRGVVSRDQQPAGPA